jgi:hypothetical protein
MPLHPWQKTARAERRRHARLEADTPGRLASGATVLEGRIEDVSDLGVGFVARGLEPAIAVGSRVRVWLLGAAEQGADLVLEGTLVRTETLCDADGDSVLYGIAVDPGSAAAGPR